MIKIDENEIFDLLRENEKVYCVYKKTAYLNKPDSYVTLDGNDIKQINASKSGERQNLMTKADAQKARKLANAKEKYGKYRIADYYRSNGMTRPT